MIMKINILITTTITITIMYNTYTYICCARCGAPKRSSATCSPRLLRCATTAVRWSQTCTDEHMRQRVDTPGKAFVLLHDQSASAPTHWRTSFQGTPSQRASGSLQNDNDNDNNNNDDDNDNDNMLSPLQ